MAQQELRINNLKSRTIIKNFIFIVLAVSFFLIITAKSLAVSDYVLPYPSSMPGSLLYKPHLLLETILKYWYFGTFGQFTYNLRQSDKYLVESKTLFEYQQYLLGFKSLQKSDSFFNQTLPYLQKAKAEGKDISQNRAILSSAAEKHIEVLTNLEKEVPEKFNWQPEKSAASELNLKSAINTSIKLRQKYQ